MAYKCEECAAGTYQPYEAVPPHSYETYTGDTENTDGTVFTSEQFEARGLEEGTGCLLCPAGFYCDVAGMGTKDLQPKNCPAGYYCEQAEYSTTGTGACPNGTYSSMENLRTVDQCWLCKEGHYCANIDDDDVGTND